jgi:hypothetical protein
MDALVVGGAACVWDDIASLAPWTPDIVVAANDAIAAYPGRLDHAATLHPEYLAGWRAVRGRNGGNVDYATWSRRNPDLADRILTGWNRGSSGLFAIGVALEMGANRVVLAGVPMTAEAAHFFDPAPWDAAARYREAWEKRVDAMRGRVFSCGGWTRELLGGPEEMVGRRAA